MFNRWTKETQKSSKSFFFFFFVKKLNGYELLPSRVTVQNVCNQDWSNSMVSKTPPRN